MASYVPSFFGIVREACLHQQSVAVAFQSETDNLHASPMKVTHPFPWFSILPDDIAEDREDTVASYWSNGDACLLRVSGFRRDSGPQVSAARRLSERGEMGGPSRPSNLLPRDSRLRSSRCIKGCRPRNYLDSPVLGLALVERPRHPVTTR